MMIACRPFSGLRKDGTTQSKRFLPTRAGIVYVLDELALKAHNKHDSEFQSIYGLLTPGTDGRRHVDDAFKDRQGYDLLEFLSKFVKPVQLMNPDMITQDIAPVDWQIMTQTHVVWVNVQDGARTIATPCIGQLVKRLKKNA